MTTPNTWPTPTTATTTPTSIVDVVRSISKINFRRLHREEEEEETFAARKLIFGSKILTRKRNLRRFQISMGLMLKNDFWGKSTHIILFFIFKLVLFLMCKLTRSIVSEFPTVLPLFKKIHETGLPKFAAIFKNIVSLLMASNEQTTLTWIWLMLEQT